MPYMKLTTLFLPVRWIQDLDELVRRKRYANRADAIRAAIRDLLVEEIWQERRTWPAAKPAATPPQ